jgi:flagellar basal body-associated protein FliL
MSDDQTADGPVKAKRSRLIPILLATNVLFAGGAVATYFLFLGGESASAEAPAEEPHGFGPLVEMVPIVANLNSPDSGRYIKIVIHLEARDADSVSVIEEGLIPMRDRALVFFTDVTAEQTVGAEAKETLRAQLLETFNEVLGGSHVAAVYFSEFVIQ